MAEPSSYDAVPYESFPFAQSHPARLSGMAKVFGLSAPTLATARVLELGCAFGGNLLPLAERYPSAQFVGVDLSEVHISHADEHRRELSLENVRFRQADIVDLARESDQYDYIIAHGVYSWVHPRVQRALLQLVGSQLSPTGVGYVSYNVYPGWKMREVVREMMLFHVRHVQDPATKLSQARALLQYASELHAGEPTAFGRLLAEEAELLMRSSDSYLFHDHLETENRPCYFHEFVAAAAENDLAYLGEPSLFEMLPDRYGADLASTARRLSDGNLIACEQYVDLLTNRAFRSSLLVHADRVPDLERALGPASFSGLHLSAQLTHADAEPARPATAQVRSPDAVYADAQGREIAAHQPHTRAMIDTLIAAKPYAVPFSELVDAVGQSAGPELDARAYVASEIGVLLTQGVATIYGEPMPRPAEEDARISPYARWHASKSDVVTNALHELVRLTPTQARCLRADEQPGDTQLGELLSLGLLV